MRPLPCHFSVYLVLFLQYYGVHGRGRRIDIFSQSGSDMTQMRTAAKSKTVMFNALPRNSPLKWSKIRDTSNNYVIPYMISGQYGGLFAFFKEVSLDPEERSVIADAMGRIEANTCIRFKKRTFEKDYIDLQNTQNEGCYTNVGRMSGKNVVMLEANEMATCVEVDIVVHELMHAIGLWHEHMRYDRDDYIKVHYENIDPIYMSQFEKVTQQEATTYDIPYDYKSVMHYAETAFARKGKISMETKDPQYQKVIGNQRDASPSDYKKICAIYGCPVCMGEDFNPENPNSQPKPSTAAPPPVPPSSQPVEPRPQPVDPVFPPVTYPTSGQKKGCREVFSVFCQQMARRSMLDCRFAMEFCECTCQQFSNVAVPLTTTTTTTTTAAPRTKGFFERIWNFFAG